jgi:hypothetical protein
MRLPDLTPTQPEANPAAPAAKRRLFLSGNVSDRNAARSGGRLRGERVGFPVQSAKSHRLTIPRRAWWKPQAGWSRAVFGRDHCLGGPAFSQGNDRACRTLAPPPERCRNLPRPEKIKARHRCRCSRTRLSRQPAGEMHCRPGQFSQAARSSLPLPITSKCRPNCVQACTARSTRLYGTSADTTR